MPSAPPLGAFGAPVWAPAALIWATAAFDGGERKKNREKIWGVMGAPYLGRRGCPGRGVSLAYVAFGGDRKLKKKFGTPSAPQMVLKT